eukprot:gene29801-36908_t
MPEGHMTISMILPSLLPMILEYGSQKTHFLTWIGVVICNLICMIAFDKTESTAFFCLSVFVTFFLLIFSSKDTRIAREAANQPLAATSSGMEVIVSVANDMLRVVEDEERSPGGVTKISATNTHQDQDNQHEGQYNEEEDEENSPTKLSLIIKQKTLPTLRRDGTADSNSDSLVVLDGGTGNQPSWTSVLSNNSADLCTLTRGSTLPDIVLPLVQIDYSEVLEIEDPSVASVTHLVSTPLEVSRSGRRPSSRRAERQQSMEMVSYHSIAGGSSRSKELYANRKDSADRRRHSVHKQDEGDRNDLSESFVRDGIMRIRTPPTSLCCLNESRFLHRDTS